MNLETKMQTGDISRGHVQCFGETQSTSNVSVEPVIFFDVDTLEDFMRSDGALPVPKADSLRYNLGRLTKYASSQGSRILKLGTADCHTEKSAELKRNRGPFEDHCMAGTHGRNKIDETNLPIVEVGYDNLVDIIPYHDLLFSEKQLVLQKDTYDVATNPNFIPLIAEAKTLGAKKVIVYGVATDYCDKAAALALKDQGLDVYLVIDAIAGITPEGTRQALEEMESKGVKFITTDQAISEVCR